MMDWGKSPAGSAWLWKTIFTSFWPVFYNLLNPHTIIHQLLFQFLWDKSLNLNSFIIKTIEFLAGKEHFKCFNDYIAKGGLDGIIKRRRQEKFLVLNNNIEISIYSLDY